MKKNKKTDAKLLKERIAEGDAIISSVGDHVMGLVIVDKEGKILRINQGFEALTGWKRKEVIGNSLVKVIPRKDKNMKTVPFEKRILSKILAGKILTSSSTTGGDEKEGDVNNVEKIPIFYYVRKDKSKFPASSVITPMVINKEVTGAVEVFHDITKEKELEQIRMDFLSLAAHQLRTPLSGIRWLIETMNSDILGKTTEKQKEYLGDMFNINKQMISLVSDMLNTLRLESEETLLKKEKISVASLFEGVLARVSAVAKEKKVKLQGPLNHKKFIIKTDPEVVKSILGIFLSNAIDYSKSGQKVILDVEEESKMVVFYVRDFGIGVPKSEQKRMFQRFYRASNAKKLKPTGTGLGLNIANTLAEKIGAKISFKSEENEGATFYLRIPKK